MATENRITAARLPGLAALLLAASACGQAEPSRPAAEVQAKSAGPAAESSAATPALPATNTSAAPSPSPARPAPSAPELSKEQIEAEYSPGLAACLNDGDAAQGVTVAMADCFGAELALQDDQLNAAYRSAMSKRDPEGQARLRTEERAWIRQRDARCKAAATGGSIDRIAIPACLLDETIRRRVVLQPMAG